MTTSVVTIAEDRYRTLLDASIALADQPTVKAILHSLRGVLSSSCRLYGAHLWVFDDDGESLHILEFDREADAPPIKIGTKLSPVGLPARVLEQQMPLFVPDISQEMSKQAELAPFASESVGRSAYLFPVSTSRKKYGLLAVTKSQGEEFLPEDVELLRSMASHIAVALECALARDRAEHYQRELAGERDRLRLVLEITNDVTKLDINDVLRSASASIRSYFESDSVAFWVLDEETGRLQKVLQDFPGGKGVLAGVGSANLSAAGFERLRTRKAYLWSIEDINKLPESLRDPLKAESIESMALAPLATEGRPLGLLVMGSRKTDAFGQEDLDLLSQIGLQISLALDNALAHGRLNASAVRLEEERLYLESEINSEFNFEDIVGKSAALRNVLDQVAIVAPTSSTVLLHGETGTGKELIARAIHNLSPRRERTFVRLNCAAIPSGLVESELFGHEKGAFTGALTQKKGRFELADHGTFFLDEIGDITMDLQPKILRVLAEQEFERLGSTRTIHVDVRMIAATHRDLEGMIRNNQFREDLFYRLNVFPIEIPPLRHRREDIQLLVHFFVSRHSRRMQKRIRSIPTLAMDALVNADWPGNIRELENFIERCVILTQGDELNVPRVELKRSDVRTVVALGSTFEQAEKRAIIDALRSASGKIAGTGGAAERLGLKRTTLQNK
ncbi:MAG TPA: sigma 54-interacting transcriptional regulator, partial [Terriglobales bacterium]|nr:sigma 54-interacting transcriptional regulator [Terriglobales bacterium]